MSNDLQLPPKLAILYAALPPGKDIHVLNIYQTVLGKPINDQRYAQQVLGSYITKLNRRLKGIKQRVEPGSLKATYRLSPLV